MRQTIFTLIFFALVANVSAQMIIVDTAGKVIRQIPLSDSNKTDSITIEGGSLSAGTYLYTLVCDGKPVDTKRMILTK